MKVINNCLKIKETNELEKLLTSNYFPWFCVEGIVFKKENNFQFTHMFYSKYAINSTFFDFIRPILKILNPVSIIKIKANLLTKDTKIIEHTMHVDVTAKGAKTAIYYVNTNNGYTKFINKKIVNSEKNKLIIFDSQTQHTGTTCTDKNYRIVLNFNYFEA
jgi:hypothetical protein